MHIFISGMAGYTFILHYRNPDKAQRPSFEYLVKSLGAPAENILTWSQNVTQTCPEALILGAPLEHGQKLYLDLQNAYIGADENEY